jgi:hypothetical protein
MNQFQHSSLQPFQPPNPPVGNASSQNFDNMHVEGAASDSFDLDEVFDAINEPLPNTPKHSCGDASAELPPPVRFYRKRGRPSQTAAVKQDTELTDSTCYMHSDSRALRNWSIGQDLRQSEFRSEDTPQRSRDEIGMGRDCPFGNEMTRSVVESKIGRIPTILGESSSHPVAV